MTMTRVAMGMAAVVMGVGLVGRGAVVVPVKAYVKPGEPIVVKFLDEKGEEGKKAVQQLGLEATKLEGLFAPAPSAEVAAADGKGLFTICTMDGKVIPTTGAKPMADGTLDLTSVLPQIKDGGTYVLSWKDAQPLVIETLYNPGRGANELEKHAAELNQLPADQKQRIIDQFGPTAWHIVPLEAAVITTDKGVIEAKFAYDYAPHTVDNFIYLSRNNFYDGSAFHRIISGFMIQGGDSYANIPGKAGSGGPGYEINSEFSDKLHERGTLSMARSDSPDSAGSQFFIMHAKTPHLDGGYTAFGDVIEGMDVVDAIAKTPVSDGNGTVSGALPAIVSVKIVPATLEMYGLKK